MVVGAGQDASRYATASVSPAPAIGETGRPWRGLATTPILASRRSPLSEILQRDTVDEVV
jgi:hypothetical protein